MKPKQSNNKKQLLSFVSLFSALPLLYVPFVSEHVPSPHVPLHNMGSNGKNYLVDKVTIGNEFSPVIEQL